MNPRYETQPYDYTQPTPYDLQTRIVPSDMELTVDPGMRWGEMPRDALISKFEETYTGEQHADLVQDYVRNEIMDRRYDKPLFEDEAPRGRTNQQAGYLQLIHYGHRGNEEVERPEQFLGFGGYEEIDPRGVVQDPNMEKMKDQAAARMRFVNFKNDANEQITGLGRSESQAIADNLKVRQWTRRNLKIFDRQLDGRQTGLRRTYEHRPAAEKTQQEKTWGDRIKDWALTPQRQFNVMKPGINPLDFAGENFDQDLKYARYGQSCRRARRTTDHNHPDAETENTAQPTPEDRTPTFKVVAQSVKVHAAARANLQDAQSVTAGVDMQSAKESLAVKRQTKANISTVLHETRLVDMRDTDLSAAIKNPAMVTREHMVRQVDADGITAPHHFLNAEVIRKAASLQDMSAVRGQISRDTIRVNDEQTARCVKTQKRQSGNQRADIARDQEEDPLCNYKTKSYRLRGVQRARTGLNATNQHVVAAEDSAQIRRANHDVPRRVNQENLVQGGVFNDNTYKDRRLAVMGSKYNWNKTEREMRDVALGGGVDVRGA